MYIYKFVRTEYWQLCLGEFDVKEGCIINDKGNDIVDVQTIRLLHTYILNGSEWKEVNLKKVYSIIQLHNTNLATFEKEKWVTSENDMCGFHAFKSKECPLFQSYRENFAEQCKAMSKSFLLPLPSLEDHYRY
jgi:hypothetical protein